MTPPRLTLTEITQKKDELKTKKAALVAWADILPNTLYDLRSYKMISKEEERAIGDILKCVFDPN